ncbi:hypothetical protein V7S43_005976 [Phytophthora oleae]|uniref:histone acetyltransferase n=1 Tax=Phytophthora oleae TaxID=2107226 RepID=A0ABD3FSJ5_9STRA
MTEATDKEAQPPAAPADEVVGASQSSSQSTEDSMETSQGTESSSNVQESKQSEETAASKDQPDVEMDEAKDEAGSKETSQDVDMEPAAEEKAEDNEAKTEEKEPADDTVDKANAPSEEKTGDVEMKTANETAQEADSDNKGAPTEEVNEKKPTADGNTPKESKETDAEAKDAGQVSSPKRKDQVQIPETSNGAAASEEPAAKKQKVITGDPKTPEKEAKTTTSGTEASPSVMLSRDDMAKLEEDSGRLKFDVISNDGTDEHMIQLTTLKNIFAKQLPKMPKEYIVRLVFDKNHRSMLLLKNGTHVIGGICYRPFEKNQFAEIAFCAINAPDQVKGYGTRLMNHLKEYVKTKNITHFLTYADNYAIGYFKKQGFTKSVSMARPNWYGYIKDYDGGTLMECTIHTQINYLRITSMIHRQRKVIQDKIQERSRAKVVYPGLTQFAEGRLMDIYMVPGVSTY